jgi:multisubunit Na+/H+ antiporter MnhE subunit
MSTFFAAIASGLVWMGLVGETAWSSFAFGVVLGLLLWRFGGARARRPFGPIRALHMSWLGLRLGLYFAWELVLANAEQLRIVLAPRIDVRPRWIHFRTELETPAMRALLGVMISLTPGSLTYEESLSQDGSMVIGIHVLNLRDEARLLEQIRRQFEAPLHEMEQL